MLGLYYYIAQSYFPITFTNFTPRIF